MPRSPFDPHDSPAFVDDLLEVWPSCVMCRFSNVSVSVDGPIRCAHCGWAPAWARALVDPDDRVESDADGLDLWGHDFWGDSDD